MADYKLTYFNIRGRGEPIRLLFALVKVKYDEKSVTFEDWPAIKASTPWGALPILQVGDHIIAQTCTIARFLARRFNLAGADEFEITKCEEIVDAATDLGNEQIAHMLQSDADKAAEQRKKLVETTIPHYFAKFEEIQIKNGGSYMVGQHVTWADVWIANVVDRLDERFGADISWANYPALKKLKQHFFAIPQIKEYVSKRPPSAM